MSDILARRTAVHVAGTILLLAATLTASRVTSDRRAEPLVAPLSSIPLQIGSFTGEENPSLAVGVLNELKATDYLSRSYQQPDMDADLFIAFYARQRPGES